MSTYDLSDFIRFFKEYIVEYEFNDVPENPANKN